MFDMLDPISILEPIAGQVTRHNDGRKEYAMKMTFNTSAGNVEDDFPVDQPLSSVKVDVMSRAHLDPEQAGQYIVFYDGATLDESKTIADIGVAEGALLILWRTGAAAAGTRTWDRSQESRSEN